MLTNNNLNKKILSAILLSATILLVAKEIRTEIINNQSNDTNHNSEIIFLEDGKMVIDGQIVEVSEVSGYTYVGNGKYVKNDILEYTAQPGYTYVGNGKCIKTDEGENTMPSTIDEKLINESANQEEQKNFTEEELEKMIDEGTAIKKRYGNSVFYVYCIEVPNGTNNGYVPNGYKMYEELRGFKYGDTSQIVYERTGIYYTEKKEYSRIRTK